MSDYKLDDCTPGPWKISPMCHANGHESAEIHHGKIGEVICTMESMESKRDRADAALIADAPNLLAQRDELLEALEEAMEWNWMDPDVPQNVIDKCEAAIKKVRGEA